MKATVEGRLNHGLAFLPPTTQSTWTRISAAVVFGVRVLLNDRRKKQEGPGAGVAFVNGASFVLERAEYQSPTELYQRSALRFMYSALLCGRAYGTLLEREEVNTRTRRVKVLTTAPHPQLKLLPTNSSHLRSLQPHRLRGMWNHLP